MVFLSATPANNLFTYSFANLFNMSILLCRELVVRQRSFFDDVTDKRADFYLWPNQPVKTKSHVSFVLKIGNSMVNMKYIGMRTRGVCIIPCVFVKTDNR